VQPDVVVLVAGGVELARQVGRVGERAQVWPVVLDVPEQARPLAAGDARWLADALGGGAGARAALARAVRRLGAMS
jgi:hypothetical protein